MNIRKAVLNLIMIRISSQFIYKDALRENENVNLIKNILWF